MPSPVAQRAAAPNSNLPNAKAVGAIDQPTRCIHCGNAVPAASAPGSESFCCSGCRSVYYALKNNGLAAYYQQAQDYYAASPEQARPQAQTKGLDYAHFDDPGFHTLHVQSCGELSQVELYLEGLHCPACVWLVEKLPQLSAAVESARVNFGDGRVLITWDRQRAALSSLARTLDSLGYPPHPAGLGRSRELQRKVDRLLLIRIGVAGAVFGNVMLFSFALYSGAAQGMNAQTFEFFRWASLLLAVPSILWTASPFFRGAWSALKTRTAHMDVPISIGILVALLSGSVATVRGTGEIYFDTITMLVFLLLLGRWLGARQQRAASAATDLLLALAPSTCRWVTETGTREVPTISVPDGALVEILAGDRIGIDGEVIAGQSEIDESWLSGESRPLQAKPGTAVSAGTVNLTARLLVRATRTGRDTRLADLVRQVETASRERPPILLFADRMSGLFTFFVLALAGLTLWIWGTQAGVPHAVALLIVTCPCALGLATPLAASVALGRAARRGVLIKGIRFIELLAKPALIVFDKTGTLTLGKQSVVDFDGSVLTAALVRAAERGSAHPIAQALDRDLPLSEVLVASAFQETPGGGVQACVGSHEVRVGSAAFVFNTGNAVAPPEKTQALIARGLSPLYVTVDGVLAATAGIGDALRPDAKATLLQLRVLGYRFAILSGDRQEIVDGLAQQLGVDFEVALGARSPEQKLRFIEAARTARTVLMVGDGVNDAAALAAASVGIAVQGGAEASIAAADVFATRAGLRPVLEVALGARRTLRVIRINLVLSLAYNLCAAALSVAGLITPLIAAILMPLSSLTVLINSLRAKTFNSPEPTTSVKPL